MSATLDKWLDAVGGSSNRDMFYRLVEHLGMRVPIMAAQEPFRKGEIVYLALPTFLLPRYEDMYPREKTLGRVLIVDVDERHGFYLANKDDVNYWLPCFFFHRDKTLAKQTYEKQLFHMIEENKGKIFYNQEFSVPQTYITASRKQMAEWFYEEYDKPNIAELKVQTKHLGF